MKQSAEKIVYTLLREVFVSGAYSNIMLDKALKELPVSERPAVTRLFYGTLERSITFDYIIAQLVQKPPKKAIAILIKMGLYLLRYTETPPYAAIDKIVELAKEEGKAGAAGFVNAVLRRSSEVEVPRDDLSAYYSFPRWATKLLTDRYGAEFTEKILSAEQPEGKHIRVNKLKIGVEEFESKLKNFTRSPLGYYIRPVSVEDIPSECYTVQSLSSMIAVNCYLSGEKFGSILDLCAAPGGKAVYLKELLPEAKIVCNDVYPHRVELIRKYAKRMGVSLEYECSDAAQTKAEWLDKFDLVVCDAPCSGLGVRAKPDVFITRKPEDVAELAALQSRILDSAARYVRKGGVLCYSTCTLLKEENEDVAEAFLQRHGDFSFAEINYGKTHTDGEFNIYPQEFSSDGFFVARFRRAE